MTKRRNTTDGVGFGRPPIEHQFKAGRSGNPKGRPKGSRNFSTDLKRMLDMTVPVEQDGKRRRVSTLPAAFLRLREKAIRGDPRAIDRIIELAMPEGAEPQADGEVNLAAEDQAILDAYYIERSRGEAGSERAARKPDRAPDEGDDP